MKDEGSRETVEAATMSIQEAGRHLGIGRDQANAAAKAGTIPVIWFGTRGRVPRAALARLLSGGSAT